ncbi:MAG: hypothetical protein ACE5KM_05500, partial [Planctomycetaceae bacterium]
MKAKFDFKQFSIAHGEKVAIGVVGLLAFVFLVAGLTQGTYDNDPKSIKEKAEKARQDIANSEWPQSKAEMFRADDRLGGKIALMLRPIPGNRVKKGFLANVVGEFDLYVRDKPLVDPKLLAVRSLIADFFRADFAQKNLLASIDGEPGAAGAIPGINGDGRGSIKESRPKGKLKLGGASGTDAGGVRSGYPAGYPGGTPGGMPGDAPEGTPGGQLAGRGGTAAGVPPLEEGGVPEGGDLEGGEEGNGFEGNSSQFANDGKRVIGVRGIVRLKEQHRLFEKALNYPENDYQPRQLVGNRISDFVLERAISTDGGKTWNAWKEVDKQANVEYFKKEVADYEAPVVAQRYLHPGITSPLPMRLLRSYGDEASHPEISRLTEEERKKQEAAQNVVAKLNSGAKKERGTQNGGYWGVQRDINNDTQDVMSNQSSSRDFSKYYSQQRRPRGADEGGSFLGELNNIRNQITADADVLLFRYFDMDVMPGLTYKYRVRLEYRNPLFNMPVERLAPESVASAKARFRLTPFSNETAPVTVPRDADYFVDKVRDRGSLRVPLPTVNLHVFQWFRHLGTTADAVVKDIEPGHVVGGEAKADQIDPARQSYDEEVETTFQTHTLMLDMSSGELGTLHMKNLGLPSKLRGKVNVPDEIVVIDEFGRIRHYDQLATSKQRRPVEEEHKATKEAVAEAWAKAAETD